MVQTNISSYYDCLSCATPKGECYYCKHYHEKRGTPVATHYPSRFTVDTAYLKTERNTDMEGILLAKEIYKLRQEINKLKRIILEKETTTTERITTVKGV